MGPGAEKLRAMFADAVESLATDFLPGESLRAAKKRRTQAAMTIEAIRRRLIEALAKFPAEADDEAKVEIDVDDISAIKDKKKLFIKKTKPKPANKKTRLAKKKKRKLQPVSTRSAFFNWKMI